MGYRHKRRTVERSIKKWLQHGTNQRNQQPQTEDSISLRSHTTIDSQNNCTCSSTDQQNNNMCFSPTQNDQNPDDDAEDIEFTTHPDDESVNDSEFANDSESTTNIAREYVDGRLCSEGLPFSQTDTAMLSVYDLASQRGVSITFIEEVFKLLRRMDADKGGIEISKTSTRKTLMKRLKQLRPKKNPVPAVVQVPSTNIPVLRFSFLQQIMDLIESPIFQNMDNLVAAWFAIVQVEGVVRARPKRVTTRPARTTSDRGGNRINTRHGHNLELSHDNVKCPQRIK